MAVLHHKSCWLKVGNLLAQVNNVRSDGFIIVQTKILFQPSGRKLPHSILCLENIQYYTDITQFKTFFFFLQWCESDPSDFEFLSFSRLICSMIFPRAEQWRGSPAPSQTYDHKCKPPIHLTSILFSFSVQYSVYYLSIQCFVFSKLCAQCGVWIHDPEIRSSMLCQLSQPSLIYIYI